MNGSLSQSVLDLVAARRGHFLLESGHHADLWFELDTLFSDPWSIDPYVHALILALRPYDVAAICGPLTGGAFLAQLVARGVGAEFCFTERVGAVKLVGMYQSRYRLPSGFPARVQGMRVAVVDDIMSAGSALKATSSELKAHGAVTVVVGALLVLGTVGADYFVGQGTPIESLARVPYQMWLPAECPLCHAGQAIEATGTGEPHWR